MIPVYFIQITNYFFRACKLQFQKSLRQTIWS